MRENKKCDKCLKEQSIDNFYIKRDKPMNLCKSCKKERDKENRNRPENKEKIKQRNENWNNKNKEYFKDYRNIHSQDQKLYKKEYREKNKERVLEYDREYRQGNREEINKYQREYREKNKEKYKYYYEKYKDQNKNYREKNKDRIKERINRYFKERKDIDPLFKLSCNIRSLICRSINKKGYSKNTKSYDILGIDFDNLKLYFESKFEPWMNWDNHGLYNGEFNFGWDIDHIVPISSADNEEEIIKLNHYSNLQPLCSKINREIKKSTI